MKVSAFMKMCLVLATLMLTACGGGGGSDSSDSSGGSASQTGTVEGYVSTALASSAEVMSQGMLSGVTVSISGRSATTDANGYYRLADVEVGSCSIMASKAGYQSYAGTVNVAAGQTVSHNIALTVASGGSSDTMPPSIPMNLNAAAASSSQINLTWSASTDNVGVAGYKIYRGGSYVKSVNTTSASDTGLAPDTQYCYGVSAYDAAGNESAQSQQGCPVTQPDSGGSGGGSLWDTMKWNTGIWG